jgi:hypothetical protein
MAVPFRFISTKRDRNALIYDEYMFRVNRQIGTKKYWKCYHSGCNVSAITDGANVVKPPDTQAHGHPNDDVEVKRKEFKHEVTQEVNNYCIYCSCV